MLGHLSGVFREYTGYTHWGQAPAISTVNKRRKKTSDINSRKALTLAVIANMKYLLFIISFLFLISACECRDTDQVRIGVAQLSVQRSQWQDNQLSNYTLTYRQSCFCTGGIHRITVTNGVISDVALVDDNGNVLMTIPAEEYVNYYTVDGLFDLVAKIDQSADKLSVEYDSVLGYPSVIDVDPVAYQCDCYGGCSETVDDEYRYDILSVIVG